jgi:MFS transporter, FSR family, fosmidomycin resistance protein
VHGTLCVENVVCPWFSRLKMNKDASVIGVVGAGHALSHFLQLVMPPLFPLIREDLGISYSTLGFLVMIFFAASALLQPVAGFLVDRVGGRDMLLGGVGLMSAGMLIASLATSTPALALGMLCMGVGNSVFHPADFSILNGRVSPGRLGYAFSAHGIAGSLGFAGGPIFSAAVSAIYGWHAALLAAAAVALVVFVLMLANAHRLHVARPARRKESTGQGARVLLSPPVLVCFLFFLIWGGAYAGISTFAISAMQLQFGIGTTFASSAITAYMLGSATGMLAGGYVATRFVRHDVVAGLGLSVAALVVLAIATGALAAAALPGALGVAGFAAGITYPSRDLIVRASTPPGAAGRVYGFVYSGLDLGVVVTPMFYGMLIDQGMPQAVFYTIFAFSVAAIFTVLQLPGRGLAIRRT